jgi:hypothetical protein
MASAVSNSATHTSPTARWGSALELIANASPSAPPNIRRLAQASRVWNRDFLPLPSAEHVSTPNSTNMSTVPTSHETTVAIAPTS